jgi:hypothetical protein
MSWAVEMDVYYGRGKEAGFPRESRSEFEESQWSRRLERTRMNQDHIADRSRKSGRSLTSLSFQHLGSGGQP